MRVIPNSKTPRIEVDEKGVTVRVNARPVEGAANLAARRAVAEALHVAPSAVSLVRGTTSREKTLLIAGLSEAAVAERLMPYRRS